MKIIYNCSKCDAELIVEVENIEITANGERHLAIDQDHDIQDFECDRCGHSNLIKIYLEVE